MNNDLMRANSGEPAGNVFQNKNRLESIAYWIFLVVVILAPLAFWANPYVSIDLVKTFVIAIGTIASVCLLSIVAIKERRLSLPPKSLLRISSFLIVSIIISAFLSIHVGKSIFGQGFEIGSASFIILLFFSALVAFTIVSKQRERAIVIYTGIAVSYIIVYILQILRLIFGPSFVSLGILNSVTSSIVGGWYNFGSFSMLMVIVSLLALLLLKLSSRMKAVYWTILLLSFSGVFIVSDMRIWQISTLIFLGLSIFLSREKWVTLRASGQNKSAGLIVKSLAWIPIIALVASSILLFYGPSITNPVITKMNAGYSELILPWQMTLDVTASTIQNYPLFGVGPNHFSKAFLAYKPAGLNLTNVWATEFSNGFGLIPTFVATQGLVGLILWILFFVFLGITAVKALRRLPSDSEKRFMIISSFTMASFLWLMSIVSVPSHTIFFFAFVLTGLFLGVATTDGALAQRSFTPTAGSKLYKFAPSFLAIIVLVFVVWGLVYMKKTIALSYFASGVKELTVSGNTVKADAAFTKALKLDSSDIYWQAKAETALVAAKNLAATVTSDTSASTSQNVLNQITTILNQGLADAKNASKFDPTNYYNFLSEARVSEAAANVKMTNGYENAVQSYTAAINMNPLNPAIYLSLASLEARQGKYDDSLRDLGKALQVKNNYLDAVFLLSQVYAAKGDIGNATIAAKVAVQLNPQNSLLLFQLGILDYSNKNYTEAAQVLGEAVKVQPDYANAKYFLGLSEARLNNIDKAITQFQDLSVSNPDNQEVALILANLKNGRSIFADAKAPITTAPEKRSSLPIKEKR